MGVQRLKKKTDLNYKKGGECHYCSQCNQFVPRFEIKSGENTRHEPRCKIMGLEMSIAYRINKNSICDAYNNSEHIKRIRGY